MGVYWSVEQCGWVSSPGPPDALATPWSWQVPEPRRVDEPPVTALVPAEPDRVEPSPVTAGA